jgi:large subunit ribosomal protein L24
MAKIKKGDLVVVISGSRKDRGKQGRVLEVLTDRDRVLVEGVHRITKHTKVGQSQRGSRTGGIETVEAPIHIRSARLAPRENRHDDRSKE